MMTREMARPSGVVEYRDTGAALVRELVKDT